MAPNFPFLPPFGKWSPITFKQIIQAQAKETKAPSFSTGLATPSILN